MRVFSANKGFSLIEVAIAIVIIGIVSSFVLKGRDHEIC